MLRSDCRPIRNIRNCPRCGGEHHELVANKMQIPFAPPEAGGLAWTHWAVCPTNGDPILVMVVKE